MIANRSLFSLVFTIDGSTAFYKGAYFIVLRVFTLLQAELRIFLFQSFHVVSVDSGEKRGNAAALTGWGC